MDACLHGNVGGLREEPLNHVFACLCLYSKSLHFSACLFLEGRS